METKHKNSTWNVVLVLFPHSIFHDAIIFINNNNISKTDHKLLAICKNYEELGNKIGNCGKLKGEEKNSWWLEWKVGIGKKWIEILTIDRSCVNDLIPDMILEF